jgi:hypothetical protein
VANIVQHGACGTRWTQVGNQTGHCSGCHETFGGEWAFERHQQIINGKVVCRNPLEIRLVGRKDRNTDTVIWGQSTSHMQRSPEGATAAATSTTSKENEPHGK